MTDKQQPPAVPERIWISPRQAEMYAKPEYLRDPSDTEQYARVRQTDEARVEEIRKLQTWRREHADKFKMNALRAACADIDYLLSLLPQLSSSG